MKHSILANVLDIKRVHIENVEMVRKPRRFLGETFEEKQLHVHLRPIKRYQCRCSICNKVCPVYDHKSKDENWWRAANLNGIPVYLFYQRCRIHCQEHGVLSEMVPWEDGRSRFTETFNNEVAWMALQTSKLSITMMMGINWRTVGNCIKSAHDRIEPDIKARLHGLRRICVDETSYSKGHSYITVVYDMDRNQVVWIHENHGKEIFEQFCRLLNDEERDSIELVAGDGAKWIDLCVADYFPNAVRCVDFFHVAEWGNTALDEVRSITAAKARREYTKQLEEFRKLESELAKRCAEAVKELAAMPKKGRPSKRRKELESFLQEQNYPFPSSKNPGRPKKEGLKPEHQTIVDDLAQRAKDVKGSKYALGHKPGNCTEAQKEKIMLIENAYPDLYKAYQLKESLRLILHLKDIELATTEIDHWITDASSSGLKPMQDLSEKINRHRTNILNSIRYQANSAKSESTNTTIKVLIKTARGFRNLDNMKALIYMKCSDLVIPLYNRPQPSPEKRTAMRLAANEKRKAREVMTA